VSDTKELTLALSEIEHVAAHSEYLNGEEAAVYNGYRNGDALSAILAIARTALGHEVLP
jgi:hypothetical protein